MTTLNYFVASFKTPFYLVGLRNKFIMRYAFAKDYYSNFVLAS